MKQAKVLRAGVSQRNADGAVVDCKLGDIITVSDETWNWLGPQGTNQLGSPRAKLDPEVLEVESAPLDEPSSTFRDEGGSSE